MPPRIVSLNVGAYVRVFTQDSCGFRAHSWNSLGFLGGRALGDLLWSIPRRHVARVFDLPDDIPCGSHEDAPWLRSTVGTGNSESTKERVLGDDAAESIVVETDTVVDAERLVVIDLTAEMLLRWKASG